MSHSSGLSFPDFASARAFYPSPGITDVDTIEGDPIQSAAVAGCTAEKLAEHAWKRLRRLKYPIREGEEDRTPDPAAAVRAYMRGFSQGASNAAVTLSPLTVKCEADLSGFTWVSVEALTHISNISFVCPAHAFDQLDWLQTPLAKIERQIASLKNIGLTYRDSLIKRLRDLAEWRTEGDGWEEYSPDSLRLLLGFLAANRQLRQPTITITPSGTFRAEWTRNTNEHLALNFLPDGTVRFVVFCPDKKHPEKIQRLSGMVPVDAISASPLGDFLSIAGR